MNSESYKNKHFEKTKIVLVAFRSTIYPPQHSFPAYPAGTLFFDPKKSAVLLRKEQSPLRAL